MSRVLKPFLELFDTVVNSYCFINDNLIALACDDGLYVLNTFTSQTSAGNNNNNNHNADNNAGASLTNISLVKIDGIESAHKLFYHAEHAKLCFVGRKTRQFLSIDFDELNDALLNIDLTQQQHTPKRTRRHQRRRNDNDDEEEDVEDEDQDDDNDDDNDEDEDAMSISVHLEPIHNIDRCHLFESSSTAHTTHGQPWYLSVATSETIFLLVFNATSGNGGGGGGGKYTLVKTIQTPNDSPCLCMRFTSAALSNQLVYGCGKEFYRLDLTYLHHATPMVDAAARRAAADELGLVAVNEQQPIGVCVINGGGGSGDAESLLLCFDEYDILMAYNRSTPSTPWDQVGFVRWPRGNHMSPLQIEYCASYLYMFYNDSIVVYKVAANGGGGVRRHGVTFVYKPRYLSTFHVAATNDECLIVSNRRPFDDLQLQQQQQQQQQERQSSTALDADMVAAGAANANPIMQDLNNKICLSYFSADANLFRQLV